MRAILNLVLDLLAFIYNLLKGLFIRLLEKFLEINVFEKGIVITTILAFLAEILPVAQYYIFDAYRGIANPLAHYMVGIVIIMLVTVYFPGIISAGVRIASNGLYLFYIIFLQAMHNISKAPYEVTAGYFINVAVPSLYIVLSLLSFFVRRKN